MKSKWISDTDTIGLLQLPRFDYIKNYGFCNQVELLKFVLFLMHSMHIILPLIIQIDNFEKDKS